MLDPVIAIVIRVALGLLFGAAALDKLRAPAAFTAAVRDYRLVPEPAVPAVAWIVTVGEFVFAIGAILGSRPALGGLAVLLLVYAGAIAVNLVRGRREIDCGCGGADEHRPLSGFLLVRNGVLAMFALPALLPTAPRSLGAIDLVCIGAAVLALALLYAAGDRLAAMAPRLEGLRRA
jgi:uncharacterized membrane protein YphA (DoxX/SURF4 family)